MVRKPYVSPCKITVAYCDISKFLASGHGFIKKEVSYEQTRSKEARRRTCQQDDG